MTDHDPRTTASPMVPHRMGLMSALWAYVMLNTLFRDIHELFRPGFITELTDGDLATSDTALVVAAIALQFPLAMIVLNHVLADRVARPANIALAVLTAVSLAGTWPKDADDVAFAGFQLIGLAAIIVLAWSPRPEATRERRK